SQSLSTRISRAACWELLTDVERVAGWVDIIHDVVVHEPLSRYEAVLQDRVGPFSLQADLQVSVTDLVDKERVWFRAEGEDRQVGSRLVIEAGMSLIDQGDSLEVVFQGKYLVEGRVATMGGSMIKHKADRVLTQ